MNLKLTILFAIFGFLFTIAQVELVKLNDSWQLQVNDNPFEIKGVTFGYDNDYQHYDDYFKELKYLGVNTIRTWATGEHSKLLLDTAQKFEIKVMLGIWMRHGRPGMEDDDSFNYLEDVEGMKAMYKNAMTVVDTFKDHPALLTWGVGNEVYLNMSTDEEKIAYSKFLEKVCSNIKRKDPNHPITSVEAWNFGLKWWQEFVPSIDIYGLNCYGPGANYLQEEIVKTGVDKPYIITEFGVTGEWDIKETINGVIREPTDTEKYSSITDGYKNWITNKRLNLGVFIFHYSSSTAFLAPWLLTHYAGKKRPQYWAIREAYTGKRPDYKLPKISKFICPEGTLKSDTWVPITLTVSDVESENLKFSFAYNQRTGSRARRDQILPIEHRGTIQDGFELLLPKVDGPTKIYAFVEDVHENLGMATSGIVISDENARNRPYLVPIVELPFYIYREGEEHYYTPSAYMGNYKDMLVDNKSDESVKFGKYALKIQYSDKSGWYGLGMVNPANDWGDILGGYDITGAKRFVFWAKASSDDVIAKIGFGLIEEDKSFPDTAIKSVEVKLNSNWKKYTINVKNLDLRCIRSGLTVFTQAYGFKQDIYIDEVYFE